MNNANLTDCLSAGAVIGLTGAAGSGKTTFAKCLQHTTNAVLHCEGVRAWLAQNRILRYEEINSEQFVELQQHLLKRLCKSSSNVFDGTPVDSIVFARQAGSKIDQEKFRSEALECLNKFTLIVLFPFRIEFLVDDGARIMDPLHQLELASEIVIEARATVVREKLFVFRHDHSAEENINAICTRIRELGSSH